RLDHGLRLLRAGCAVEIDQRAIVHRTPENGELRADGVHIERADQRCVHEGAPANQLRIAPVSSSRSASDIPSGIVSVRNASINNARASASGMPRERM